MNINPNKLTITQLFATNNELFVVPSYQRRYAWGENQYMALFDDIRMLKDNDGHLFGTLILHVFDYSGDLNQPEIVDGQQRITTLMILLKALETVCLEKGEEEIARSIRRMTRCSGLNEVDLPKVKAGDLDNPDIEKLILNEQHEGLSNANIGNAYRKYLEILRAMSVEQVKHYFRKLTNVAVVIRLDVAKPQDAYKLFETINNRGLRLSATDVVKNFLLGHASKIKDDTTLKVVKSLWSQIIVNMDRLDSDDFFRQYICSILGRKVPMSKLVPEFKKYYMKHVENADLLGEYEYYCDPENSIDPNYGYDEQDEADSEIGDIETSISDARRVSVTEFLQRLLVLSTTYMKVSLSIYDDSRLNRRIENLNNILSKPSYIFLMHFLEAKGYDKKEIYDVLCFIETLMLRRHICEKRTSVNDEIFSKMVAFVGQEDILDKIKVFLRDNNYMPTDAEFAESFPKHLFRGKLIDRAKYVLQEVEYYKRGNTDELKITSKSEVHLEHIIPQCINTKKSKEEYGDWEAYLGPEAKVKHSRYVDLIGNMTLLGEKLNIAASNNPFARKQDSYAKSSFLITKPLADQPDFRFAEVDSRGSQLTDIAIHIWKA